MMNAASNHSAEYPTLRPCYTSASQSLVPRDANTFGDGDICPPAIPPLPTDLPGLGVAKSGEGSFFGTGLPPRFVGVRIPIWSSESDELGS